MIIFESECFLKNELVKLNEPLLSINNNKTYYEFIKQ